MKNVGRILIVTDFLVTNLRGRGGNSGKGGGVKAMV